MGTVGPNSLIFIAIRHQLISRSNSKNMSGYFNFLCELDYAKGVLSLDPFLSVQFILSSLFFFGLSPKVLSSYVSNASFYNESKQKCEIYSFSKD